MIFILFIFSSFIIIIIIRLEVLPCSIPHSFVKRGLLVKFYYINLCNIASAQNTQNVHKSNGPLSVNDLKAIIAMFENMVSEGSVRQRTKTLYHRMQSKKLPRQLSAQHKTILLPLPVFKG